MEDNRGEIVMGGTSRDKRVTTVMEGKHLAEIRARKTRAGKCRIVQRIYVVERV